MVFIANEWLLFEQDGRTPLHEASFHSGFEVCKWLVAECGCDPAVKDDVSVLTPANSCI